MAVEFHVGDRVQIIQGYDGLRSVVNTNGTVCQIHQRYIGVAHDLRDGAMHNCEHCCESGHGWYYPKRDAEKYLKFVSDGPSIAIQTIDELL